MKKRAKNVALGSLLAAGVGYLAGILTAPKSGKETRKDIEQAALKAKADAERKLKEIHSELDILIEKATKQTKNLHATAQHELTQAVETARQAKIKARNLLSALHEGDSVDNDLKKAVKEAKAATEHLKKYIEKHEGSEAQKK
jgi:gas vesicle protein